MKHGLHITRAAENDMNEAADYMEFALKNPRAAVELLDEAGEKISTLSEFPERYALIDDPVLTAWGMRFIQVGNYLAFYTVEQESHRVLIVRFLYEKRDWAGILKQGYSL